MQGILKKYVINFTGIEHDQDKDIIRCKLCASQKDIKYLHKKTPGIITYKKSEDIIGGTLPDYFRNVNKFLKKHIDTQIHKDSINRLREGFKKIPLNL